MGKAALIINGVRTPLNLPSDKDLTADFIQAVQELAIDFQVVSYFQAFLDNPYLLNAWEKGQNMDKIDDAVRQLRSELGAPEIL